MNISVVIPALNEEETVAHVVDVARSSRANEVIVVDSDSTDATAQRASDAGARVVNWREIAPEIPVRPGKGEALWRGVKAATGDVIVFIDADVTNVEPWWVDELAAPFEAPDVQLVKANYTRLLRGAPGGGRVTELTAKPLIHTLFPHLGHIEQPLGGEYAIRAETALRLPFVDGYGIDVGLLLDISTRFSAASIGQVDLGQRTHRNRPISELKPMAEIVARTIMNRAEVAGVEISQRPPWR
ncbi:glucosyl-3-phosphoglycerate synthase [Corynebacterium aquatimens]|uniref:Glucosyl-3-phosphoglycerate synthase n=1 Tax=Corynebacterium aquatimens TaxID=1190508 RepID=A0A931E0D1_9CORY|nr:glucosyl-3-phosphoglycerate synthase [Corynebacterium aquatimens]MBG6121285.1 glucosyl-3-phosphoglycerate synthase [Corynebacterium aquatimens]WJY66165.1 Glucosyl-3-phosphoglycerate synthase [Corynebacterium aquatimens]